MATEEDMKQKLQEALELESDALVRRIVDTESTENRQKLAKDISVFLAKTSDQEILSNIVEALKVAEEAFDREKEDDEREQAREKEEEAEAEEEGEEQEKAEPWPDVNSAPKLDYKENYYSILEIDANTKHKPIKKAFFKMVKKYHPDSFPNDEEKKKLCEYQMMVINEAYATLSDFERRSEYDKRNPLPYRVKSSKSAGGFGGGFGSK